MKILGLIPARGGSKRIPYKNIRDFENRPVITYPIETAVGSNLFERVIVSTDSGKIADIAKQTKVAPFAVYGGFDMSIQLTKLNHGVHILVATPGRLIDMLYNTPLSLSDVSTFVLDEADEMLKMGFIDDVEFVISCLIHDHQTLLFSATMPPAIKRLSQRYLKEPITIELNTTQVSPENLTHCFGQVGRHDPQRRCELEFDSVSTRTDPNGHEHVRGPKDSRGLRVDARHPPGVIRFADEHDGRLRFGIDFE